MGGHAAGHSDNHDHHADWHSHSAGEGAQAEHAAIASPGQILKWFIAIVISIVVIVVLLVLYFNRSLTQERYLKVQGTSVQDTITADYTSLKATTLSKLESGYSWSDPAASTVQIPLAQARERVMKQYAAPASK